MKTNFTLMCKVSGYFVCLLLACPHLLAQAASPNEDRLEEQFLHLPNAWQLKPAELKAQSDTVTPMIRNQRNKYWQSSLAGERQLIGDLAFDEPAAQFPGATLSTAPEIPVLPMSVWVIASFDSFHVYEAPIDQVHQVIYTEMNYKVSEVINTPKSLQLAVGDKIDVAMRGGRVKHTDGTILTSRIYPAKHFVQLNHKYLLQLLYNPETQWYVLNKEWDVTSGQVTPDSEEERYRASKHQSALSGMTIPMAVQYIRNVLF